MTTLNLNCPLDYWILIEDGRYPTIPTPHPELELVQLEAEVLVQLGKQALVKCHLIDEDAVDQELLGSRLGVIDNLNRPDATLCWLNERFPLPSQWLKWYERRNVLPPAGYRTRSKAQTEYRTQIHVQQVMQRLYERELELLRRVEIDPDGMDEDAMTTPIGWLAEASGYDESTMLALLSEMEDYNLVVSQMQIAAVDLVLAFDEVGEMEVVDYELIDDVPGDLGYYSTEMAYYALPDVETETTLLDDPRKLKEAVTTIQQAQLDSTLSKS
jgi:hypothetical protein